MDLATSLGHLAGGTHPDVVAVVESTIARIAATGVVAGVLAATPELAHRYVAAGARFVAAGVDTGHPRVWRPRRCADRCDDTRSFRRPTTSW